MKEKILIIEDDKNLRETLTILLQEEGYDVLSAGNGEMGVAMAGEYLPDLIISDILMPGLDGYEVLNRLSNNKKTAFIPFIFLTAKTEYKDIRKGMELGADDYLLKPYDFRELLKVVRKRLEKYKALKTELIVSGAARKSHPYKKLEAEENVFLFYHNTSVSVKVKKILYIAAENQYSKICTVNNQDILIRRSLNEWEKILPENMFKRIHRSTIINIEYLDKIEKYPTGEFMVHLFHCSERFKISRRYMKNIRKIT